MPLIILGNMNGPVETKQTPVESTKVTEKEPVRVSSPQPKRIVRDTRKISDKNENDNIKEDEHHHVLVVDGKKKLVAKQSRYLLDMLTIEKE
jgi:IMP dehydrogenase/GMP reductase